MRPFPSLVCWNFDSIVLSLASYLVLAAGAYRLGFKGRFGRIVKRLITIVDSALNKSKVQKSRKKKRSQHEGWRNIRKLGSAQSTTMDIYGPILDVIPWSHCIICRSYCGSKSLNWDGNPQYIDLLPNLTYARVYVQFKVLYLVINSYRKKSINILSEIFYTKYLRIMVFDILDNLICAMKYI